MLKPEESQVFAGLMERLQAEDPNFARRAANPPRWWATIGVLLWTAAPICIVLGGWTGLIEGILAGIYGSHLLRKRQRWIDTCQRQRSPVSRS